MAIPEGSDWAETRITLSSEFTTRPLGIISVKFQSTEEDTGEGTVNPWGPPSGLVFTEVGLPSEATHEDYDLLVDTIVAVIVAHGEQIASPGKVISVDKKYYSKPTELAQGS